jgi:glycosyltransferase involved in cell wall biosynthesis
MKIALIGQKGAPTRNGGVERYAENLAVNLVKSGHEVLLYSRKYYSGGIKEYKGVRIISVPSINTKSLEAISNTFFACLDVAFRKVDIINVQSIGPAALIWLLRILKPRTPIIFTFHCQDYYHKKWGKLAQWFLRFGEYVGCRLADKVIVTSRNLVHYVNLEYGFMPVYIPYGAYTPEKVPVSSIRRWGLEDKSYIVYIGRLVRHKGVHHLINAYKQIQTDKKLVIVGGSAHTDDYVAELHELAKDDNRIIFTDNQSGPTLKELFSNAYIFVQPSEYEGLSVALLEAMGWGLACLVSDIPQSLEGIADTGVSFLTNDSDDLRDKLRALINDPEKVERLGRLAADRVRKEYNWDDIAVNVIKLSEEVIEERKR